MEYAYRLPAIVTMLLSISQISLHLSACLEKHYMDTQNQKMLRTLKINVWNVLQIRTGDFRDISGGCRAAGVEAILLSIA